MKNTKRESILSWAGTLFVIAIVMAMLGYTKITGPVIADARIFFYVLVVLSIGMYVLGKRMPTPISSK